ncbi:MAG TPA: EAL domain-containing protein [Burkholderiaceae bacterium]|nr:EAL domain-containing protein [Burkholderiaceae bacterium]
MTSLSLDPVVSGRAGLRKTLRQLRLGFAGMTLLIVLVVAALAWRSWREEKDHELLYLSSLVEITGKSLDGYFATHARALRHLGAEILASRAPLSREATRHLLIQTRRGHPDLLHVVLFLPDGRAVMADDADPGPRRMDAGARESFRLALDNFQRGQDFDIGRVLKVHPDGDWVIPLRLGVRNPEGQLVFVLSAALPVSRQQVFWQGVPLPPQSALGLIRDDGFLISRFPEPNAMDYEEAYGKPRNGQLREYLVSHQFPLRGVTEGYNSVSKADYLFAFHRLSTSPLTVFVSTPLGNVRNNWFKQSEFSVVLLVCLLVGGYGVYRRSSRQLLVWDSERAAHESQVEFLAQHDPLTELPNRLLASDRFRQAVALAERNQARVALLFLDLDYFKGINDSLGHDIGDLLLQEVAHRLNQRLGASDTLSRQGGDEFLVMLADVHNPDVMGQVAQALLDALKQPFHIDGHELVISASIGIAVYPDDGHDFGTLLRKADTAMYKSKDSGRNTHLFYTEQMNVDADERLKVRGWLAQALAQDRFVLHYQPQVRLGSGAVMGFEALIRLQQPLVGLLPPGRFIATAEDTGLIVPMGLWVLHQACAQAQRWRSDGWDDLVVAVNISAVQLRRGHLEQDVRAALLASGLPPTHLELELTESLLIEDPEHALTTLNGLKAMGVRLSIDDFGTGYSSLAYLKRFKVDRLKIDQSFVRDLRDNPDDAVIVQAIIQMAHSLGLVTIAEGVEDENTSQQLRDLGCDEAQGYFWGRPMDVKQVDEYLLKASSA